MLNSSSMAMTTSTASKESSPKVEVKEASALTLEGSTFSKLLRMSRILFWISWWLKLEDEANRTAPKLKGTDDGDAAAAAANAGDAAAAVRGATAAKVRGAFESAGVAAALGAMDRRREEDASLAVDETIVTVDFCEFVSVCFLFDGDGMSGRWMRRWPCESPSENPSSKSSAATWLLARRKPPREEAATKDEISQVMVMMVIIVHRDIVLGRVWSLVFVLDGDTRYSSNTANPAQTLL